ncbi:MAG: cytochrome b/b6 domain-containing protein [Nitrospirales bacterium]|nr:cytochrome b/b6 domain-containing protein [Nitrospirales bacterium]
MKKETRKEESSMGLPGITIHLGIMAFGIAAWLTGEGADDYKKLDHSGFTLHSWIGIGVASFVFIRLIMGLFGPSGMRFSQWIPYNRERLGLVGEDIKGLFRLRLPDRESHQGLAGLVQTFGIAVFTLMALTGGLLFFLLEPGQKAQGLSHDLKEIHEAGEALIPLFLLTHAGAVLLHTLTGKPVWKRIFTPRSQ